MATELTLREALDLVRSYHTRIVRPFEKLGEVLETAFQTIEHDWPAAQQAVDRLTTELATLRAQHPDVAAAVKDAQTRVEAAHAEADAAERTSLERIQTAERLAEARETSLVRDFEHKGATLQRDFEARRDLLTAEISTLEAKKRDLDQALLALETHFTRRPT